MEIRDLKPKINCPYCNKNYTKKYGFTKKGTQRYRCICGKTFILEKEEKPNCPICKNDGSVICWGKIKYDDVHIDTRYRKQRYYCKKHKISFSERLDNLDELEIYKAYRSGGAEALKPFVYDDSGYNHNLFVACMEIIQEYDETKVYLFL